MRLQNDWDDAIQEVVDQLGIASRNIAHQIGGLPDGLVKQSLGAIYNDQSALMGTLINYCKLAGPQSAQVAGVLMRTLMEGSISVFAFCQDPPRMARLYHDFQAVLDFKFACADGKYVGCPFIRHGDSGTSPIARKQEAARLLGEFGKEFLNKKPQGKQTAQDILEEALISGAEKTNWFRDTWYPDTRRKILGQEGMEWLYEVYYRRLCSCVHSDAAAPKILRKMPSTSILTIGFWLWGAAIYQIVEKFRFHISADHKGTLRHFHEHLQYKAPPPVVRPQ